MLEVTPEMIRDTAIHFLAKRDLTRKELYLKLRRFSKDESLIEGVLNNLENDTLLSNDRFIEGFIHSRIQKGHGPIRISRDLIKKGIDREKIRLELESTQIDWCAIAEKIRHKKFGSILTLASKDRTKQIRFLEYRGFPLNVIMALF